jgi:hypothetical protein
VPVEGKIFCQFIRRVIFRRETDWLRGASILHSGYQIVTRYRAINEGAGEQRSANVVVIFFDCLICHRSAN